MLQQTRAHQAQAHGTRAKSTTVMLRYKRVKISAKIIQIFIWGRSTHTDLGAIDLGFLRAAHRELDAKDNIVRDVRRCAVCYMCAL